MSFLIFPDRISYDVFEAKMKAKFGLPKPGVNAKTGEVVDPGNVTGKGWTLRYSPEPFMAVDGRALTFAKLKDLDSEDKALETPLTDKVKTDFGISDSPQAF